MKILLLAPEQQAHIISSILEEKKHQVFAINSKISSDFLEENQFDFLVSYGYRFILSEEILSFFEPKKAINLHISYLPYNRGADPNFWSLYEGTPSGVTIHYLDKGIDTGAIITQKKVSFNSALDTLKSSYNKLHVSIVELFKEHISSILEGSCTSFKPLAKGSYHNSKDKDSLFACLKQRYPDPYTTPISEIKNQTLKIRSKHENSSENFISTK